MQLAATLATQVYCPHLVVARRVVFGVHGACWLVLRLCKCLHEWLIDVHVMRSRKLRTLPFLFLWEKVNRT